MVENSHPADAITEESEASRAIPHWKAARIADFENLDFESPIEGFTSVRCIDLRSALKSAADFQIKLGDAGISAARAFSMLAAIMSFHFDPERRNSPFGPMYQDAEGRSAAPEDFRGEQLSALIYVAERAINPVLKSRLCDLCWLLNRSRRDLAASALNAYLQILSNIENGLMTDDDENGDILIGLSARDIIRRSLSLAKAIGWKGEEAENAKNTLLRFRSRAESQDNPVRAHWFFAIDLDFGISKSEEIGAGIEKYLSIFSAPIRTHDEVELLRLAARAYHISRDEKSATRCRAAAAECLVREAGSQESAMHASHWLAEAIEEYRGLPGMKERRKELRHKLVDIQSGISEEMSQIFHPIDVEELVRQTQSNLASLPTLLDKLLYLADMESSPDPSELAAQAIEAVLASPLQSLIDATYHDREGKVVYRSPGAADFGSVDAPSTVHRQIAQLASFRRLFFVLGEFEPARRIIMSEAYIREELFVSIIRHSPFVPRDLIWTYSKGLTHLFRGDFASALYILVPLLEASLRYVLRLNGYDVSLVNESEMVQQDRTISSLFDQMRLELDAVFGVSITADIERVFLSKLGPSIRHSVAHGLLHDGSPSGEDAIYACWLIYRLCCIPVFSKAEQIRLPL